MRIFLTSDIHWGMPGHTDWDFRSMSMFRQIADESEPGDVLVLAGDLAENRNWAGLWIVLRELMPNMTKLCVRGNHDYWGTEDYNPFIPNHLTTIKKFSELCNHYGIIYLSEWGGGYSISNPTRSLLFLGWDGWYAASPYGVSVDVENLPGGVKEDQILRERNEDKFRIILETAELKRSSYDKIIAVSHFGFPVTDGERDRRFSASLSWLSLMEPNFDMFLFGHSHRTAQNPYGPLMSAYNSGSDYGHPKYLVLSI